MKTRIDSKVKMVRVLPLVGIVTTGISGSLLIRPDQIVHTDLYKYGLQFNIEWAEQYWTYARLITGFFVLAFTATIVPIALILCEVHVPKAHTPRHITSTKITSFLLLVFGAISLALSIYYTSSILALIGLGLVFWAAIILYIRPGKYVKETLLDKTTLSLLSSLDQIIQELGYKGKGIHLPPKYLAGFDSSKVYISSREDVRLPSPEELQSQGDSTSIMNPGGILITSPGAELARLFEETLGTRFAIVDLQYLEENMPSLLIEDLEIAQDFEIVSEYRKIHVKMENSIYSNTCKEVKRLSNICCSVGCPLCSAIACTLANVTGKPVIIEKDQLSEDGHIIDIEYRLLE